MGFFTKKEIKENSVKHFYNEIVNSWPTEKFLVEDEETNSSGQVITPYWSQLDTLYFWFFDAVEVRMFEGMPNKNFIFESRKNFNLDKLKKLVNELALNYGKDDNGREKFKSEDEREIQNGYWSGRNWLNAKHPAMVGYGREEGVSLTFFYTGE